MKQFILLFLSGFLGLTLIAQPAFMKLENSKDIGNPDLKGSVILINENQSLRLSGSGYNIWFERDEFFYYYLKAEKDFIATAVFEFEGEGTDPHRKTGWMIRSGTDDNSKHVSIVLHGDGLNAMQWRSHKGGLTDEIQPTGNRQTVLQLEKLGKKIIARSAKKGEPLQIIGEIDWNTHEEFYVGLFVSSHNEEVIETVNVSNVRVEFTVPDDYNPYGDGFLDSRLEILDVFSSKRTLVKEFEGIVEAPNWMPGGEHLLYNQGGSLFKIPVSGGNPMKVNTGFANRNNNDHGISLDGKLLAISHHRDGLPEGGSTVYILPLEGGEPKLVTENTPSYWHGWDPDNEHVVYVAQRPGNDSYNIYRANIHTRKEEQLTNFSGSHVDGCEYSPDGKYIYYNGSQSGVMQLWRMKPDGSDHEQLTFDEYYDWFPHISPDGKWIAFLSFPNTIGLNDHPYYKRVMLRLMPADGGPIRTIAYLYGGQGSINVPSWSPDSKKIAFVSFTK